MILPLMVVVGSTAIVFTRPSVVVELKQPEQPVIRSGCGPSAVKLVVLSVFGLARLSLRCCPAGTPTAMRSCCATAARTQAGSNRPVGYVKRSCQYCSNCCNPAASLCPLAPGTGM